MSDVQKALSGMRTAASVDEGDDYADDLARAARQNPGEVIELFYTTPDDAMALVWCLQGLTDTPVIELFKQALKHRNPYVRWAAVEGLKYSSQPALIPVFIAVLKDRAHMVKGVAVEWLYSHGDTTAIEPLERLIQLPGLNRSCPGTIKQAKEAVSRLRAKTR